MRTLCRWCFNELEPGDADTCLSCEMLAENEEDLREKARKNRWLPYRQLVL